MLALLCALISATNNPNCDYKLALHGKKASAKPAIYKDHASKVTKFRTSVGVVFDVRIYLFRRFAVALFT